jgi:ribonuclease BN (tRNA processing enzyme)
MLPEIGIVLDAGSGFFRVRDHLITDTFDVFLTHAHLDHVMGLTFLIDVLYGRTMRHVRAYATPDAIAALEQHLFAKAIFPAAPSCEFRPIATDGDAIRIGNDALVRPFSVVHPGGATGYFVESGGRKLAYVTDTTAHPAATYVKQIAGADLLIHECYFPDGYEALAERTGHSCATPVGEVARAAGVKRLLLVHCNPLSEESHKEILAAARAVFPNTDLATDGMEIDIR